jgi:alpha-tubulin suppressor-like RCC1 family protein
VPAQIGTETGWVTFVSGEDHTLLIRGDGTLWCFGYNSNGQLGLGTMLNVSVPTQMGADSDWEQLGTGAFHSFAKKSDGTIWAWGLNADGQLGDGTLIDQSSPVLLSATSDWATMTGGWSFTIVQKTDGTLSLWGRNDRGELGNGTFDPAAAPNLLKCGELAVDEEVAASFLMYPNPVSEKLTIEQASETPIEWLEITDASGKVMRIQEAGAGVLDVSGWDAGMYLLRLRISGKPYNYRFCKIP